MDLELELVRGLEDVLAQFAPKFNENRVKIYWCRRRKAKICDLVASLTPGIPDSAAGTPDCLQELIREVIKKSKEWIVPLEKCEAVSMPVMQFNTWFNRGAMTTVVLNSVGKECKEFSERSLLLPRKRALIYAPTIGISAKSCNLSELRTLILMQLIDRILETKRFEAWTSHHIRADGICQFNCGKKCKSSETSGKPMQQVHQTDSGDNAKDIDLIGRVDCLQPIIESHLQKSINVRVLVTHRHADAHSTAVQEFFNSVTDNGDSTLSPLVTLIHGPVVWRNNQPSCITAEELYRMQHDVVKNSFAHKYGAPPIDEGNLGPMFEHLADLNIKFHMLACSTSKTVQLKIDESDSGGTFVMYNYARICVLLSNFAEATHNEVLSPLPPIEEVDFALLKKEEEWNLVLLLARYPKLIDDIAHVLLDNKSDSNISPAFHSIIEFVSELGHRTSVYYRHVRVLMPAVHLKDVMFARLWLLKCVKLILEDIFGLLNVTPVKQM